MLFLWLLILSFFFRIFCLSSLFLYFLISTFRFRLFRFLFTRPSVRYFNSLYEFPVDFLLTLNFFFAFSVSKIFSFGFLLSFFQISMFNVFTSLVLTYVATTLFTSLDCFWFYVFSLSLFLCYWLVYVFLTLVFWLYVSLHHFVFRSSYGGFLLVLPLVFPGACLHYKTHCPLCQYFVPWIRKLWQFVYIRQQAQNLLESILSNFHESCTAFIILPAFWYSSKTPNFFL